jgi:pyruvate formate-lyase activating enzyme-like uncharacterized protein
MSDDTVVRKVKHQITADFILHLYDDMKETEDEDERQAKQAAIDELSKHLGDWLILDE